jgi:hypothetical protein
LSKLTEELFDTASQTHENVVAHLRTGDNISSIHKRLREKSAVMKSYAKKLMPD